MYTCASYIPQAKRDTTRQDSIVSEEEVFLDEDGNPILRKVEQSEENSNNSSDNSKTNKSANETKKDKKRKPSEQQVNLDDL